MVSCQEINPQNTIYVNNIRVKYTSLQRPHINNQNKIGVTASSGGKGNVMGICISIDLLI